MHTTQTLEQARPAGRLAPRQIARSKLLILLAAVISFLVSVSLWFTGHENQGLFVGLWVPSILSFGSLMLAGRGTDSRP
jgi:ABC-type phosphate/phosphonate transport system permease subunit